MEDEDKPTAPKDKEAVAEPKGDNPPAPVSIVEEAKALRDEILQARDSFKEENDRRDKAKADDLLGSSAGGHVEAKKETEDEKWAKDAKERYAGTGMDPTPDDSPTVFT